MQTECIMRSHSSSSLWDSHQFKTCRYQLDQCGWRCILASLLACKLLAAVTAATMEIKIKPPTTTTTTTTKFSFQFFFGVCSELNSSGCCCSYQFEIEITELWLLFQKLNKREKSNDFSYKLTATGFWIFVCNLHYKFSYSSSNKDLKEQRFYETDPFTKLAHNWNVVVKLVCKWEC